MLFVLASNPSRLRSTFRPNSTPNVSSNPLDGSDAQLPDRSMPSPPAAPARSALAKTRTEKRAANTIFLIVSSCPFEEWGYISRIPALPVALVHCPVDLLRRGSQRTIHYHQGALLLPDDHCFRLSVAQALLDLPRIAHCLRVGKVSSRRQRIPPIQWNELRKSTRGILRAGTKARGMG